MRPENTCDQEIKYLTDQLHDHTTSMQPFSFLCNNIENKIDGAALFSFTETATELLIPIIGEIIKFLKALKEWKTIANTNEEFASTCQNLEEIEKFPEDWIVHHEIEPEMPVGDNNFEPRYAQHI